MELVNQKHQRFFNIVLLLFFILFAILPVVWAFTQMGFSFYSESLSSVFFKILTKSVVFAFLQSALSILAISFFSFFIAILYFSAPPTILIKRALVFCATFLFTLSPTLLAFTILHGFRFFNLEAPLGIGLIVFCHFMLNALFFSVSLWERIDRFLSLDGEELLNYLNAMGATSLQKTKLLLLPLFKSEASSLFPQIFVWCFTSFSPVILLGEYPRNTSPETLLYYSLLNDLDGTRMFVIFISTFLLSLLLYKIFPQNSKSSKTTGSHSPLYREPPLQKKPLFFQATWLLITAFFILPFLPLFVLNLGPLFKISSSSTHELLNSATGTLFVAILTMLFSFLISIVAIFANSKGRQLISRFYFLSPVFILMGWLETGFLNSQLIIPHVLVALGLTLTMLPWILRQIDFFYLSLPDHFEDYAQTLGMNSFLFFKHILWPQSKALVIRISCVLGMWSFGEFLFSNALLPRAATLSLYIEDSLQRYRFNEASGALLISIAICLLFSVLASNINENRNA